MSPNGPSGELPPEPARQAVTGPKPGRVTGTIAEKDIDRLGGSIGLVGGIR
ncbi:hypothetical protein ACFY3N_19650 [Streptomyces sp. NPDC000348]|uniref:hypothetical protein n=1 Tax=Streptomyces sp. NPDC000348 TaxID=3364538 RepID=UPI00368E40C8